MVDEPTKNLPPLSVGLYVEGSHVLMVANRPGSTVTTSLAGSTPITSPKGYWRHHPITVEARVNDTTDAKVSYDTQPHSVNYTISNLYLDGPTTVDVEVTHPDGTMNSTIGIMIPAGRTWAHSWTGPLKDRKTTSVTVTISNLTKFTGIYTWSHTYWGTIREDITGSTFYDDIGLDDYPFKTQLPSPDIKVDIRDIARAAVAFGTYPGHEDWDTASDMNGDYKVDIRDIAAIATEFGWSG